MTATGKWRLFRSLSKEEQFQSLTEDFSILEWADALRDEALGEAIAKVEEHRDWARAEAQRCRDAGEDEAAQAFDEHESAADDLLDELINVKGDPA